MKTVRNMNTLKAMKSRGLIEFAPHTGDQIAWQGSKSFVCYYIDAAPCRNFTYKGNKYTVDYVDGCFYPYVFKLNT